MCGRLRFQWTNVDALVQWITRDNLLHKHEVLRDVKHKTVHPSVNGHPYQAASNLCSKSQ